MHVTRLGDGPIVHPGLDPSIGTNIQGPSLIHAPPWVEEPLGRYYLYFADHKGSYIRLAHADHVEGPWRVHRPGSLQLADSCFLSEPPPATDEELAFLRGIYEATLGASYAVDELLADATTPHIASPDAHLDHEHRRVVMYFHGLDALGIQLTRAATSADGIHFTARPEVLGGPYLRVFRHDGRFHGLTMPGVLCRSRTGLGDFETGPTLFEPAMRHSALWPRDGVLEVFWTRVGDAPEAILWSTVELGPDWMQWQDGPARTLLEPEEPWEGALETVQPSRRGAAHGPVNQLRDPAVFHDEGRTYLLYAAAGESAIGLAELTP